MTNFDTLTINDLGKRITGAVPRGAGIVVSTVAVVDGKAIFQSIDITKLEMKHTADFGSLLAYILKIMTKQLSENESQSEADEFMAQVINYMAQNNQGKSENPVAPEQVRNGRP